MCLFCWSSISIMYFKPKWIHTEEEPIKINYSLNLSYCHITVLKYGDQGQSNATFWHFSTQQPCFTSGDNIPAPYQMSHLIFLSLEKLTFETIQQQQGAADVQGHSERWPWVIFCWYCPPKNLSTAPKQHYVYIQCPTTLQDSEWMHSEGWPSGVKDM